MRIYSLSDNDGRIIDDMIFAVETDDLVHGVPNASMVEVMLNWLNPFCLTMPQSDSQTGLEEPAYSPSKAPRHPRSPQSYSAEMVIPVVSSAEISR